MAIRFNHVQYAYDSQMILSGVTYRTINLPAAVYTDKEIYRSLVNPGFNGTLEWLEAVLAFRANGTATANNLTGKWQIRTRTETTWVDLCSIPATALTATYAVVENSVFYDAVAGSNEVPFEIRLIISTDASTVLSFVIGQFSTTEKISTRCVGESV